MVCVNEWRLKYIQYMLHMYMWLRLLHFEKVINKQIFNTLINATLLISFGI